MSSMDDINHIARSACNVGLTHRLRFRRGARTSNEKLSCLSVAPSGTTTSGSSSNGSLNLNPAVGRK
jgi:hypothetical protein